MHWKVRVTLEAEVGAEVVVVVVAVLTEDEVSAVAVGVRGIGTYLAVLQGLDPAHSLAIVLEAEVFLPIGWTQVYDSILFD